MTGKIVLDIFLAPFFEQFAGVGFKRVHAGKGFWRGVVPFEQLFRALVAKAFLPFLNQPLRMREADGRVGCFQILEGLFGGVKFAQITAQDGVDKAGFGAEALAFGEFDGFMDGGVRRDFIEPEDLVEAQAKEILYAGVLPAALRLPGNEPIQRGLPADDAINQFLAQCAVERG